MRIRSLWRKQRGDTIVEVLIALAVVGFIIGSAYVITSRSTSNERAAQERSDALNLVQTQIEALLTAKTNGNLPTPALGTAICMTTNGTSYTATPAFTTAPPTSPDAETTFSEYPATCNYSANGTVSNAVEPIYHIFITCVTANGGCTPTSVSNIYVINARWFAASGNGVNNMVMYYKAE